MPQDDSHTGCPRVWTVSEGLPETVVTIAARFRSEAATKRTGTSASRLPATAPVFALVDAIWENNSVGGNRPRWMRRVLLPQGRIDRLLCDAMEALFHALSELPGFAGSPAAFSASESLWKARRDTHIARGGQIRRRLRRPQSAVNANLVLAISTLSAWLVERANAAGDSATRELCGHLAWHVKEARYRAELHRRGPMWLRRCLTDQGEVNRCLALSVKFAASLLLPR